MKNTSRKKKPVSAESISQFFTNSGRRMEPIRRVNVDFAGPMLQELDRFAKELNISRQAVIKTLVRQGLDQRRFASKKSRSSR